MGCSYRDIAGDKCRTDAGQEYFGFCSYHWSRLSRRKRAILSGKEMTGYTLRPWRDIIGGLVLSMASGSIGGGLVWLVMHWLIRK